MQSLLLIVLGIVIGGLAALAALRGRMVTLQRELSHEREGSGERLAQLLRASNEQLLQLHNESMSRQQAESRSEMEKREKAVADMVRPLSESLTRVDGRLERLDRDRVQTTTMLQEQLRTMVESQDRLRGETGALVAALRKPQTRGRWGELQLRNVVEMAGMTRYSDFVEQATVRDDDRQLRPDLIVRLPGGKQVVVDAKAPLQSFLDAYESTDEHQRDAHLQAHARLLREHVRKLSAKSYWSQFADAPDFVLLFLPGEHFLNAALEADPTLIEQGVAQHVLIATPTTLIALLRAVHYGWQQEKVAENAREISELGREVYSRLGTMAEHLGTLGRRLTGAVESYNKTVGSLETRVLVSARRFTEHGAVGPSAEIAELEPVDKQVRTLQAPELSEVVSARHNDAA